MDDKDNKKRVNIGVIGEGKSTLLEAFKKWFEDFDAVMENVANSIGVESESIYDGYSMIDYCESLEEAFVAQESDEKYTYDTVESLKKRIKYCKNPLELKQLNKELNAIYKKRRR